MRGEHTLLMVGAKLYGTFELGWATQQKNKAMRNVDTQPQRALRLGRLGS